ncbi:MAG: hypothetical protein MI754_06110 [Chromatiales bacterium]|nr:hypothetical protein [Chromatiales bacterium]
MTKQRIAQKRPFALKLIVLVFMVLPLAGFYFRLPPPLLLLVFGLSEATAFGLYHYNRYAYWLATIVMSLALAIGLTVVIVTLSLSHPEGYLEALLSLLLLGILLSALLYLLRRESRMHFLGTSD